MAGDPAYLRGILTALGASQREIAAMLTGAYLESGGDPNASGGGAYGVWQLQGDPSGRDTQHAAQVMLPRYRAAVKQVPAALWQSDPARASEQAAYLAERPAADYYATQGASRVTAAYQWGGAPGGDFGGPGAGTGVQGATGPPDVSKILGPVGSTLLAPEIAGAKAIVKNPITGLLSPLTVIAKTFGKLNDPHFWLRIGEMLAGVALLVFGVIWMKSGSTVSGTAHAAGGAVTSTVKKGLEVAAA